MNEQYIIDRILRDAKVEADAAVNSAKKNAALTLKTAREEIELQQASELATAQHAAEREAELGSLTAKTEQMKNILAEKHKIIDDVFAATVKDLLNMKEHEKKHLINSLTKKYKQTGDTVTEQNGGIVISNKTYDLYLTMDDLVTALREDIEADVAKILFG